MSISDTVSTELKCRRVESALSPEDVDFLTRSPIRFIEGNFADYIWGGHNLYRLKGLNYNKNTRLAAESWEVSGHKKYPSRVLMPDGRVFALGDLLKNRRLASLLLGDSVVGLCGSVFPVLVKFVDVHRHMSVHLHPSRETAKLLGEKDPGKEEVFIVIDLHDKAESALYLGLQDWVKRSDFEAAIGEGRDILELSHKIYVAPGDIYRIPSGVLHCWTGGSIAVEITESSDLTYRMYDFRRNRPMHIEKGMVSMDFRRKQGPELEKECRGTWQPTSAQGIEYVRTFNAFTVERVSVHNGDTVKVENRGSFDILMGIEGAIEIVSLDDDWSLYVHKGSSVLIPFGAGGYKVRGATRTGNNRVLRIKMKDIKA